MEPVGRVDSVWRYPVKGMRGEELAESFVGFPGLFGDRCYAVHDGRAAKGFPFFTAQAQERMLLYTPRFRHPEHLIAPPNLAEVREIGPGLTPLYPPDDRLLVDVETPEGDVLGIEDPALLARLADGQHRERELTLLRSWRSMTDCRPVSLFSIQTARQLSCELGMDIDKRRFRANIYLDLRGRSAFAEELLLGRQLMIGERTKLIVVHRDKRCKVVMLDPENGQSDSRIMRHLGRAHSGSAGVYGVVLEEGTVRPGDDICLLD